MALDFYFLGDPALVASVNDSQLQAISPALEKLTKSTGVFIDPYGTTRISPVHAEALVGYLESLEGVGTTPELLDALRDAHVSDRWLVAEGD